MEMANTWAVPLFFLAINSVRSYITDTINLAQKISRLSVQKASSKRNISY